MSLLQLSDVVVAERLGPISATVHTGELVHLVGPNGAGKSTLLMRAAGLSLGGGEITFAGSNLNEWQPTQLARHRAYLSQQQMPPFSMPVWHYLQMHQQVSPDDSVMLKLVGSLGLTDKLTRSVNQLSGGEWQRVRLAAVVLQIHPEINQHGRLLLLDEPMNSLDIAQQTALDRILMTLCEAGIAVVMSSHDLNHSLRHAHTVWLLRAGKMIAQGKRDDVLSVQHLATAYNMHFRRMQVEGHSMLIATL
ncbi:vitamin B12 ABC transporter ATP-binding protein BtuD [Buttiauxella noackiae]|uniref:vitamin B12 ABC transporter ATP-binding protein BtuD n=1 Tax=Buttiauxella noackiae TaxID=82992 RepID=UPI00235386F6|nr:vitamin B12 ABC transporter ATP-binding protein BtuD [Buttiauxella noackiae]MCA1923621.1 vitamin B12 ABC transporter ATP-binding protein BtuD [Buttiauxella noackiae]